MSRQNIFDNETFFDGYKALRDSDCNANDLIEQPAMRKLLPNLNGKTVLDMKSEVGMGVCEIDPAKKYYKPAGFGNSLENLVKNIAIFKCIL